MQRDDLLKQIKEHFPHLHDVEMAIRGIQTSTGYGEVSCVIKIKGGKAYQTEFLNSVSKIYRGDY